jgi:plastocyanin
MMRRALFIQVGLLVLMTFIAVENVRRVDAADNVEFKVPDGKTEFSPKVQQVKAGTQVIWINEDKRTHFLTAADPNRKEPAKVVDDLLIHHLLPPGETFQMKFDQPNTYEFFCAIHMEMRGTLTVTP